MTLKQIVSWPRFNSLHTLQIIIVLLRLSQVSSFVPVVIHQAVLKTAALSLLIWLHFPQKALAPIAIFKFLQDTNNLLTWSHDRSLTSQENNF